jgi:hypothetical protein
MYNSVIEYQGALLTGSFSWRKVVSNPCLVRKTGADQGSFVLGDCEEDEDVEFEKRASRHDDVWIAPLDSDLPVAAKSLVDAGERLHSVTLEGVEADSRQNSSVGLTRVMDAPAPSRELTCHQLPTDAQAGVEAVNTWRKGFITTIGIAACCTAQDVEPEDFSGPSSISFQVSAEGHTSRTPNTPYTPAIARAPAAGSVNARLWEAPEEDCAGLGDLNGEDPGQAWKQTLEWAKLFESGWAIARGKRRVKQTDGNQCTGGVVVAEGNALLHDGIRTKPTIAQLEQAAAMQAGRAESKTSGNGDCVGLPRAEGLPTATPAVSRRKGEGARRGEAGDRQECTSSELASAGEGEQEQERGLWAGPKEVSEEAELDQGQETMWEAGVAAVLVVVQADQDGKEDDVFSIEYGVTAHAGVVRALAENLRPAPELGLEEMKCDGDVCTAGPRVVHGEEHAGQADDRDAAQGDEDQALVVQGDEDQAVQGDEDQALVVQGDEDQALVVQATIACSRSMQSGCLQGKVEKVEPAQSRRPSSQGLSTVGSSPSKADCGRAGGGGAGGAMMWEGGSTVGTRRGGGKERCSPSASSGLAKSMIERLKQSPGGVKGRCSQVAALQAAAKAKAAAGCEGMFGLGLVPSPAARIADLVKKAENDFEREYGTGSWVRGLEPRRAATRRSAPGYGRDGGRGRGVGEGEEDGEEEEEEEMLM